MKIERITVCNIASLAGTHSVDFTQEPLRTAGLFSISGATGAGKSTLLDAMCLALFDKTPRLGQVPHLSEKVSDVSTTEGKGAIGQNETRTLLRRHTSRGFAEVAFVGVDQQSWTARWSVRRSRNSVDGRLQKVQRTLYHGHIPAGSEGQIAAQGKTAVEDAIQEKIGLTFEQFTRAVLLAQNDFATFLKADDKQRAEILQALTGTEHFEGISRAVFARCADEKKAIERLEAQLQGLQPLTPDARTEAQTAADLATVHLKGCEARLKQTEAHAEWFRQHARLQDRCDKARTEHSTAVEHQAAAADRRAELHRTEIISHEVRALRDTELRAETAVTDADKVFQTCEKTLSEQTEFLREATEKQQTAQAAVQLLQQEVAAAEPLLKHARDLDAKLEPAQRRADNAETALAKATHAFTAATEKRDAAIALRQTWIHQQQAFQTQLDKLAEFQPFVKEGATWCHRLDTAMAAEAEAADLCLKLQEQTQQLDGLQTDLKTTCDEQTLLQQTFERLTGELRDAEAAEARFDGEQLAAERQQLDDHHRVLTTVQSKVVEHQKNREEAQSIADNVADLEAHQGRDEASLRQLRDVDVPRADRDVEVAQASLVVIQNAIDDQAKRLRVSLQPDQPCPVCGSVEHPYRLHEPDDDGTAVNAARGFLKECEQQRNQHRSDLQKLEVTIESRAAQIVGFRKRLKDLSTTIQDLIPGPTDHPAVREILDLPAAQRLAAIVGKQESVDQARQQVAAQEAALRTSTKRTIECRTSADAAAERLYKHQQRLAELEKQHSVTEARHASVAAALHRADAERMDATNALGGLFSGLPGAKEQFQKDADRFRQQFAESIGRCSELQQQLSELTSRLLESNAAVGPLQEAARHAESAQSECQAETAAAAAERDELLQQRRDVLEGRSADEVQKDLANRLQSAQQTAEQQTVARHESEKRLAAAQEALAAATKQSQQAAANQQTARAAVAAWLEAYNQQTTEPLTIVDVDRMLHRDAAWFETERSFIRSVDDKVTSTRSACSVHNEQLQAHLLLRPTPKEESVVLETLQKLQVEIHAAKQTQESAWDIIRHDDRQRLRNSELAQHLAQQQTVAEPWLKLNELIGSKEGDKFRMIAQRRTLDVLLQDANYQLNQLSSRYRLERLPESLNLIVIDCDMGEERRSIHSLSGGESFLVSLALALGLASLTSNRLRIESLFIDEGFGSLDPETLTTAMRALTHLEAQGRKVGVISHVTEMTDAIPVQVKVEKRRSGGASHIVIPGADPESVRPATAFAADSRSQAASADIKSLACRVLEILQRERQTGHAKVSIAALRKEIGCQPKELRNAQSQLADQVIVDGRSLRLVQTGTEAAQTGQ